VSKQTFDPNYSETIFNCASCDFWTGSRELDHNCLRAIADRDTKGNCNNCNKSGVLHTEAGHGCGYGRRWSAIRGAYGIAHSGPNSDQDNRDQAAYQRKWAEDRGLIPRSDGGGSYDSVGFGPSCGLLGLLYFLSAIFSIFFFYATVYVIYLHLFHNGIISWSNIGILSFIVYSATALFRYCYYRFEKESDHV